MNSFFVSKRVALAIVSISALAFLTACSGHKIIAKVKDVSITDADLAERALTVDMTQMQGYPNADAGGVAVIELVRDSLVKLLAKEKGSIPSDDDVKKVVAYNLRVNPSMAKSIAEGKIDQKQLESEVAMELMTFMIGTSNAKTEDKDLDAELKNFEYPEIDTMRSISFPSLEMANAALIELKAKSDFGAVATKFLQATPTQAAQMGKEQDIPVTGAFPPDFKKLLSETAIGAFVATPAKLTIQGREMYVLAQIIKRRPAAMPTKDEVRPMLTRAIITRTNADWQTHFMNLLAEFTDKLMKANEITVNTEKYKVIVNSFITQQVSQRINSPTGATAPPTGSAPPSSTSPPSGGTSTSPPPAPTGAPSGGTPVAPSGSAAPGGH